MATLEDTLKSITSDKVEVIRKEAIAIEQQCKMLGRNVRSNIGYIRRLEVLNAYNKQFDTVDEQEWQ